MNLAELSPNSRVWVFIANQVLSEPQVITLNQRLQEFVASWKAHGAELTAGFELRNRAAVIVGIDESKAAPTGCSIDKAFRLLQEFGAEEGLDFFQRTNVAFVKDTAAKILSKNEAKLAFEKNEIHLEDLCLNPLVNTVKEYQDFFVVPFSNHWLGLTFIVK